MRRFGARGRAHVEASVAPDVGLIADRLMELEDDLDAGEAMVAADSVRRALVEAALKTIEKELDGSFEALGTKKLYLCIRVVKRNDPGACGECGIAAGGAWARVNETDLRREDLEEHVAERLDRGMYASENCPGCERTMVLYRAVEVED